MFTKRFHPGLYLKESLETMEMTAEEFSERTELPKQTVEDLIEGKIGVSSELASKLASFFGTSPDVWIHLQASYDASKNKQGRRTAVISNL